jgi:excinuclease Cho
MRCRVTPVGLVVLPDPADGFEYPAHIDRASLDALPRKAGVYLFRDRHGVPVYIGKSVDIRSRVLSHLRTPQEAAMLHESSRVDYLRTAGEIGALLLESQMIKKLQPAYNAQLKEIRDTFALALAADGRIPRVLGSNQELEAGERRHGLFASRSAAQEGLSALLRRHGLCPALTGVEATIRGRACFSHQIGRCGGACVGKEPRETHDARLRAALLTLEEAVWPYAGPVGILEQDEDMRQVHVVDRWSYLGSLEGRRRKLKRPARRFADADTYRILARPMLSGQVKIGLCEVERDVVTYRAGR